MRGGGEGGERRQRGDRCLCLRPALSLTEAGVRRYSRILSGTLGYSLAEEVV